MLISVRNYKQTETFVNNRIADDLTSEFTFERLIRFDVRRAYELPETQSNILRQKFRHFQ